MEISQNLKQCMRFLKKLKYEGKSATADFVPIIEVLQNEATTRGLDDVYLELIMDVIRQKDLGSAKSIRLIKCLIPKSKIPDKLMKRMLIWFLSCVNEVPMTTSIMTIQWILGVWDYHLAERKIINIFYDVLFYVMLKKEKLDRHIARLIYVLTKPEDVTRRNATRLIAAQYKSQTMQKHVMALLSLFKSYKPELVPERIKTVNIENVWRPIPETLRLAFEKARARSEEPNVGFTPLTHFKWAAVSKGTKAKQSLVPSVGYFQFGSSIFREKDAKSIFDLNGMEDLGKYQLTIDLPCNATSLLSNMAGYHLLTFADFQYQSRFSYNLYNTLQKAFILESGKFSKEEMEKLLDMTIEFSRYMQQGVLVVNLFLDEYLYLNTGKHRLKLLSLMEWMTCISVFELQDKMFPHIRTMYYEADVEMKCKILRTLRMLIMNLFVNQAFDECRQTEPAPFLGQGPIDSLTEIMPMLMRNVDFLVTSGLNIHSYNILLLDEALALYEQVAILEERSNMQTWTLAPHAVIYGGFISKSCAILSRVCGLLYRYCKMNLKLKEMRAQRRYKENIRTVAQYAGDIVSALWFKEAFSARADYNLLRNFPTTVINDLSMIDMDKLLSLEAHCAILPLKIALSNKTCQIKTKEDMLEVLKQYFPQISNFLTLFQE